MFLTFHLYFSCRSKRSNSGVAKILALDRPFFGLSSLLNPYRLTGDLSLIGSVVVAIQETFANPRSNVEMAWSHVNSPTRRGAWVGMCYSADFFREFAA